MAEIYIFCFPIFFPNMSGISDENVPCCKSFGFSKTKLLKLYNS